MVKITGKFEHVSFSSEFENFLKESGAPEEFVKGVLKSKPTVSVEEAGADKLTISVNFGDKENATTFKLGEVYDDRQHDGTVAKSVTTRDGNTLTTETTHADGRKHIRATEYTADGFNLILTDEKSGKKGITFFARV